MQFGEFELDRERRQLLRSGQPVPLEPKAYELLCLLVDRRPKALSRAQIRDAVWPETFISESTLGVVVNGLRQALGDDAKQPRFIRTVRRFGYAFSGEVRAVSAGPGPETAGVPSTEDQAGGVEAASPRPSRALRWGATGAALAVFVGGWLASRRVAHTPEGPLKITPFTTDGGFKEWPQLSPDAEKVAYSWAGPDGDNWDVYIKAVGPGTRPFRLTEHPAHDWSPVWSPDGRRIAFVRDFVGSGAIYTVPSLGGQKRKLADVRGPVSVGYYLTALSWSPDGEWLAFAEKAPANRPARIVSLSLRTLERRPLTSPPSDSWGDFFPAVSPDGRLLAFVRSGVGEETAGNLDVWVQPLDGGRPRQLTRGAYNYCHRLGWTPKGDEIVFTAGGLFSERLYRVSLDGGDPRPVPGAGEGTASASARANRMVFLQMSAPPWDIWRVPGRISGHSRPPEKLIASSQQDTQPVYSPDGRRIAFASSRSGHDAIWICDADGSHPVQLTSFESMTGTPRWSPDGRSIIFDSVEAGDWNVYAVDVDGGLPRRLTHESSQEYRGVWSPDGQWIYFTSDRGELTQIWRIPSRGGRPVQVTRGGAVVGQVTWDNRHLYFSTLENGIRRVPPAGGEETEVVQSTLAYYADWALSRTGLYYATERARVFGGMDDQFRARVPTEYAIHFLDFESGELTELLRKEGSFRHRWLAVSPDEEWILYAERSLARSEILLVENFH